MNRREYRRRQFLSRCAAGGVAAAAASLGLGRAFARTFEPAGTRMDAGAPSVTARRAAVYRAVHQVIDSPRILDDRFAVPILGPGPANELQAAAEPHLRTLRASIVMRSRYAEDRLSAAVARGVRQYVNLGAGLDTFAYRNPHAQSGLRVFEVDHPATQRYKRDCLENARIGLPSGLTFVPIDFERQKLREQLAASGFRFDEPAFFSLLGVVIYLTDAAVMETMRMIASCATGSEVAFSFSVSDDLLTDAQRSRRERSMARVAALGEPWLTFYDPEALADALRLRGFNTTEIFTPADANRIYFADRKDGLRIVTSHMMSARV